MYEQQFVRYIGIQQPGIVRNFTYTDSHGDTHLVSQGGNGRWIGNKIIEHAEALGALKQARERSRHVSAMVREKLWERICDTQKHGGALLLYTTNNEQGYGILTTGITTRQLRDFDGLWLVQIPKNS